MFTEFHAPQGCPGLIRTLPCSFPLIHHSPDLKWPQGEESWSTAIISCQFPNMGNSKQHFFQLCRKMSEMRSGSFGVFPSCTCIVPFAWLHAGVAQFSLYCITSSNHKVAGPPANHENTRRGACRELWRKMTENEPKECIPIPPPPHKIPQVDNCACPRNVEGWKQQSEKRGKRRSSVVPACEEGGIQMQGDRLTDRCPFSTCADVVSIRIAPTHTWEAQNSRCMYYPKSSWQPKGPSNMWTSLSAYSSSTQCVSLCFTWGNNDNKSSGQKAKKKLVIS